MTDTTELVTRLRAYEPYNHFKDGPLIREAADTIERLTRERDEADERGFYVSAKLEYAEARIAKLEATLDSFVREQQSEAQAGTGEYQRGYDDCIAYHADRARAALKEPS